MTRRKGLVQTTRRLCLLVSFGLSATSVAAQSRIANVSESAIAAELFGQIAAESDCPVYAVAWLDRPTQQIQSHCAKTLEQAEKIVASSSNKTRFLLHVATAKSDYEQRFGLTSMRRPSSLLAHLLGKHRDDHHARDRSVPLLIYPQSARLNQSAKSIAIPEPLPEQSGPIIVFRNQ